MPMTIDITEARKAKLREWIDNDFDGNVAAFVSHFRLKRTVASYISQLFTNKRSFGEKAARNLEAATGMPRGWLDREPTEAVPPETLPPLFAYNRDKVAKLPVEQREFISAFIEFMTSRNEQAAIDRPPAVTSAPKVAATRRTRVSEKSKKTKDEIIESAGRPLDERSYDSGRAGGKRRSQAG